MSISLTNKLESLKTRFAELEKVRKDLIGRRAELDRQISDVANEEVRLDGAFREITALIEEEKKPEKKEEPKLEIPKKKAN